jgi:hypothetical protein
VPLIGAHRALIEEAAKLEDRDMAAWARAILVARAKNRIAKNEAKKINRT